MEGLDAGFGEGAGLGEVDEGREGFEGFFEGGDGVGEGVEAGVAADFAGGAEDADGTELFEDVGVAEDGGFEGFGREGRLVGADALEDMDDFGAGETEGAEDGGRVLHGVGDVIPVVKLFGVVGAMAEEDAEIVQPACGVDDVVVIRHALADLLGEGVEAGLVAEFFDGLGFVGDVFGEGEAPGGAGQGARRWNR